jgi:hypothetical protein
LNLYGVDEEQEQKNDLDGMVVVGAWKTCMSKRGLKQKQ